MATRRMFSKTITNSSRFLMMPQSAQNLYFHLGMNADDDGFCEHFTIMRMTDSKPDDLRILQAKGFVKIFDDKVLIITQWKENNYIRSDRYTPSKYLEIYKEELKRLSSGIPEVDQRETQVRLGKDRLGKVRKGKDTNNIAKQSFADKKQIDELIDMFKEVNPSYKRLFGNTTQRGAIKRLLDQYGYEKLTKIIKFLPKIFGKEYVPVITTPYQLEAKMAQLIAYTQKEFKNKSNAVKIY